MLAAGLRCRALDIGRALGRRVASRMRPDSTVLTIAVDSGLKYVSTELYR